MQNKIEPYTPDLKLLENYPTVEPALPSNSVIQFNTGRMYQADGQIITALLLDCRRVLFNDHSRGVDGLIPLNARDQDRIALASNNALILARIVMDHYDRGDYTHIPSILRPFRPSRDNDRLTYMVR